MQTPSGSAAAGRRFSPGRMFRATDRRTLGVVAVLLAIQSAMVFAFVFPGYKPQPHHVPVAFVGPKQAETALARRSGSALSIGRYDSEQAARAAITARKAYGAFVFAGHEERLLVASAASLPVAQFLRGAAASSGAHVHVDDTVALSRNDPRGSTINLMFLPLVVVCSTVILALGALKLAPRKLIAAVALFSILGGFAVTALVSVGLGALPGSFLALSGVTAAAVLAIALPTAGLHRLFGNAGLALGAVLFLVIANPASGNATAPELLPGFWRWISQLMPPGAGGTGLRNVGYFDGSAITKPLVVLGTYAVLGGTLVLAADAIRRHRARAADVTRAKDASGSALTGLEPAYSINNTVRGV